MWTRNIGGTAEFDVKGPWGVVRGNHPHGNNSVEQRRSSALDTTIIREEGVSQTFGRGGVGVGVFCFLSARKPKKTNRQMKGEKVGRTTKRARKKENNSKIDNSGRLGDTKGPQCCKSGWGRQLQVTTNR